MKKVITIFSAVILTAFVILSVVYATTGIIEKSLLYDDIKITLRGEELKPSDVNGNYIEPFIIEGTTYLPVRGIASALGLTVGWDDKTKTVKLNEPQNSTVLLYEGNRIKISFLKYEYTAEGDLKIKLQTDNKNMDDIALTVYNTSVNGYMTDGDCEIEFKSGKKVNTEIVIKADSLKKSNITYVKDIEFSFDITNLSDDKKLVDGNIITLTPESAVMREKSEPSENTYSDKFTYDEFVDFIKQNGVFTEDTYKVAYAFSVMEVEEIRPLLFSLSLSYSEETKDIVMSILMNRKTLVNSSETSRMYVTMGRNLQLYTFTGTLSSYGEIKGKIPANKDMYDPQRIQIDKIHIEDYPGKYGPYNANVSDGMSKFYVSTVYSEMLRLVSEHGDGLFSLYDSDLTLKFFGM